MHQDRMTDQELELERDAAVRAAAKDLPSVDLGWIHARPKRNRQEIAIPNPQSTRSRGRPAVHNDYPEVVAAATTFIEDRGFKAHRRRREETGACGASLSEVRDHILAVVPGLKDAYPKLGICTVARMMVPPRKSNKAAVLYKSLINARVPPKDNSARKDNPNSHFYASRVKYIMEMAARLGDSALVISADNKNKIRVGDDTLAVDRRIAIRRIFPVDDAPSYLDHDFPLPGYVITPAGYLELCPHSTPSLTVDHLGRKQFVLPTKGPATIVLRSPHSPTNVASHLNDLAQYVKIPDRVAEGRKVLVLMVDGGPDFNPNHAVNELHYSIFFKDTNLDALIVTSYCPGDSALNPIEHLWAPCTKALTSVYLSATLPGDEKPPCNQRIPDDEKLRKEKSVFDRAMKEIKDVHFKNLRFTGRRVNVVVEPSGAPPQQYGVNFEEVKDTLGGSARQLHQSGIKDDYAFLVRHMDKRIGTIIITKCTDDTCQHCSSHPPVLSSCDMDLLRKFPSPQPSEDHPDHFITFLEALDAPRCDPCAYMPQFVEKGLGRCPIDGCRYVFSSKKDTVDHRRKAHGRRV